jgi:hypothetical protein
VGLLRRTLQNFLGSTRVELSDRVTKCGSKHWAAMLADRDKAPRTDASMIGRRHSGRD